MAAREEIRARMDSLNARLAANHNAKDVLDDEEASLERERVVIQGDCSHVAHSLHKLGINTYKKCADCGYLIPAYARAALAIKGLAVEE